MSVKCVSIFFARKPSSPYAQLHQKLLLLSYISSGIELPPDVHCYMIDALSKSQALVQDQISTSPSLRAMVVAPPLLLNIINNITIKGNYKPN